MIRPMRAVAERDPIAERRLKWMAGRRWQRRFVPFGIIRLEGEGHKIIACRTLETRWSDKHARRLWRVPA